MKLHDGNMLWLLGSSVALATTVPIAAHAQQIEEVIVTATKREQSLQDVSAAVTAVDAGRLENAKVNNLEDLQLIVPTVTFGNDFNMAKIFIRGVGANTSTTGSEPGVALHVDGAVVARAEAQRTSLFDIERLEVLRGPQGTLYGRNATGGSINLITAKPTAQGEGYARLSLGNYDTVNAEAALGGPLTEQFRARIAVKSEERGGFGINPVTGSDVDDVQRRMARLHLQYLPTEDFDVLLTGEWFKQDDASSAVKFRREAFPGDSERPASGIGGYAADERDLASEFDPRNATETWSVTGTLRWQLNDVLTLTSINNYRDFETSLTQDLDVSAVVNAVALTNQPTTIQRRDVDSQQYSSELQLTFDTQPVDGVFGLFYFNENQTPTDTVGLAPVFGEANATAVLAGRGVSINQAYDLCNTWAHTGAINSAAPLPPKRVCIHSDLDTEAYAAFGQAVVGLGNFVSALESLSLKVGGRYSWEERKSKNPAYIIGANGAGPAVTVFNSAPRTTANPFGTAVQRKFSDFTPEGGLEWRVKQGFMAYYSYAEGFKSGSGENAAGSTTIVGPENIRNHEVGIKSEWLDRRLITNVSAFKYDLEGLQINKTVSGGQAGFTTIFENAADVSGKGVELELYATPIDAFRVNTSVAWLDSEFDDFVTADPLDPRNVPTPPGGSNPQPITLVPIQLAGNPTRNSPDWSANLHLEYDLPMKAFNGGSFTLASDVTYRDNVFFTEFHRLLEGSRAYTMLDASVRYASEDGTVTAELWGKNLTDELREASTFALATARTLGVTWLPPRTYGVTVGYNF
jgi:iron complex outermembrane recepter protein